MTKRSDSKITFVKQVSQTLMDQAQWEAVEDLLAKMIARAILRDHLEHCGACETDEKGKTKDD
jgi:hypothetical protein